MSIVKYSSIFLASKILLYEGFVILFGENPIVVDIVNDFVRYLNFWVLLVELLSLLLFIELRQCRRLRCVLFIFSVRGRFLTILLGGLGFLLLYVFVVSLDFFSMVVVELL